MALCVGTAPSPLLRSAVKVEVGQPYRLIAARAAAAAALRSLDGSVDGSVEPDVAAVPVAVAVDDPAVVAGCGEVAALGWS
jgi:hypothetical protein